MQTIEHISVLTIVFSAAAYLIWHLFLRVEFKKPCGEKNCTKEKAPKLVKIGARLSQ